MLQVRYILTIWKRQGLGGPCHMGHKKGGEKAPRPGYDRNSSDQKRMPTEPR